MRKLLRTGRLGEWARVSIGLGVVAAALATPLAFPVGRVVAEEPRADAVRGIPQEFKPELTLLGRLVSKDGALMVRIRVTMPDKSTKDVFLAIPADEGSTPVRPDAAIVEESQSRSAKLSTAKADYTLEILRFSTRLPITVKVECERDVDKRVAATPDVPKQENEINEPKKDRVTNVSPYSLDW